VGRKKATPKCYGRETDLPLCEHVRNLAQERACMLQYKGKIIEYYAEMTK
jgi:hypothetical protein